MRKTLSFIVALLFIGGVAFADATATSTLSGRSATTGKGINQVVANGDASNGYTQNIDSRGAASVQEYPSTIGSATGGTLNTGTMIYTGAARITSVTCSGLVTSAGDYVLIYDTASDASGTPIIECTVGTAKDTNSIYLPPGGVQVDNGIYADSNASAVFVSVSYDY